MLKKVQAIIRGAGAGALRPFGISGITENAGSHSVQTTANRTLSTVALGAALMLCGPLVMADGIEAATAAADPTLLAMLGTDSKVSLEELSAQRAKAQLEVHKIILNEQDNNGSVRDNTATGNETGANIISSGAFTNSAGFTSTIQNSGNNVLIQNSTIINVAVEP